MTPQELSAELFRIHAYSESLRQLCSQGEQQLHSVHLEAIFADISNVSLAAYNVTASTRYTYIDRYGSSPTE